MKRHINLLMAIIVLAGVATVGAQAQTASAQKVIASIPFSFNVGRTTLPAGKYTITVLNPTSDRKILQIRNANGRVSAMVHTTGVLGAAPDDAKLMFHRYGDRYFFAAAQMAGDSTSLAAVKSDAERAQKEAVAKSGKDKIVVIVAG